MEGEEGLLGEELLFDEELLEELSLLVLLSLELLDLPESDDVEDDFPPLLDPPAPVFEPRESLT